MIFSPADARDVSLEFHTGSRAQWPRASAVRSAEALLTTMRFDVRKQRKEEARRRPRNSRSPPHFTVRSHFLYVMPKRPKVLRLPAGVDLHFRKTRRRFS